MSKSSNIFVCSNCAYESPKWAGQCPNCNEWGTLIESIKQQNTSSKAISQKVEIRNLSDIKSLETKRISTGFSEFDRVLGGVEGSQGFVTGEVILVSGEPGIGKSTLLLQIISNLSEKGKNVMYVSAEESAEQIFVRAKRLLGKKIEKTKIPMMNSSDIDSILDTLEKEKPKFVVIDSIQTVFTNEIRSLPGGTSQVKECASRITTFAKRNNVTVIIVGHVTKEGIVAGPKLLEHLVDCVINLEGETNSGYRILRTGKNRFGSTNEVGVFEMTDKGLADVENISKLFIGEHVNGAVGVCTSAIIEGNRILLVEVQALTNTTPFALPKRVSEGISNSKLQLLCAILSRHAGINIIDKDVYVNIAGGLKVKEPAIDMAICLAIASSAKNKSLKSDSIAFGEVSLTGDIRAVSRMGDREREAKRLGYKHLYAQSLRYKHIRDFVRDI
ncbi:DNA repair protein RadA [Candidatus Dojkabacteria bacterium]|nr:DNA repair protein RadA [Candidatus Dojkabacteria bacterium]